MKIIVKTSVSLALSLSLKWVIPSFAGVLCGDWVRDRDWESVEPSSEVSSCSPSAGRGGGRWNGGRVRGCKGWMRGLQCGVGGWSRGPTAGVSGMRGQEGGREGGFWEISGNTHMLESGHAQLFFHKISQNPFLLIIRLLEVPSLICYLFVLVAEHALLNRYIPETSQID